MEVMKPIKRRNKEASIARIINATAEIFAENGYKNATYTEIARRANLNISLISRYFGSKEKLLQATLNVLISQQQGMLRMMPPKTSLKEELHSIIDILIDNNIARPNELKTICSAAAYDPKVRKELYSNQDVHKMVRNRLTPFFIKDGVHESHDFVYFVDSVMALAQSMVYYLFITFGLPESNVRDRIHYIADTMVDGLKTKHGGKFPAVFECKKE